MYRLLDLYTAVVVAWILHVYVSFVQTFEKHESHGDLKYPTV